MRPQVQLTFTIGLLHLKEWSDNHASQGCFKRRVADQACFIAGGCSTSETKGYWVPGGEIEADCYAASPVPELSFEVKLTMNLNKVNMAYEHMRYAIGEAGRCFDVHVGWVHVVQQRVIGRHFNVEDDEDDRGVTPL